MKKTSLYVILLAVSLTPLAVAQEVAVAQEAVVAQESVTSFIVTTNPPGATIYLDGEYKLVASTPASLPSNLSGQYKTRITRPGYEQWQGELTFAPGNPNAVNIDLKKKTAFKAGLRSLLIPGWGQYYSGNKIRGGFLTAGAVISLAGLYFADREYQDKRADYDIANREYLASTSFDERQRLLGIRDTKQRQAYNAETDRRTVFYIGLGLWTYNVLDAILFFPHNEAVFPAVSAIDGGGVKLTFVAKF